MRHLLCEKRRSAFWTRPSFVGIVGAWLALAPSARAAMLPTDQVVDPARADSRERIEALLQRGEIQAQLKQLGVEPAEAERRLASLSEAELQALDERLEALPAGGDSTITIGIGSAIIIVLLLIIFL